jgi:hypothetical protein
VGKTALMAWLAGAGDDPADRELAKLRRRVSASIDAVHFCTGTRTGSDTALDPSQFSQSLARQFAQQFTTYGEVLARQAGIVLHAQATAEHNYGDLAAVRVGNLYATDPAGLYGRVLGALERVLAAQPRRVTILVDGLDEAELWRFAPKIGELVAGGGSEESRIQFLVSTRPLTNVTCRFRGPKIVSLDASPEDNRRDVLTYARARLGADVDADLLARIDETSGGNFLVAKMVLDYWQAHRDELGSALELPAASNLDEVYQVFLGREYESVGDPRWTGQARPILGVLGVAQAPLSAAQLAFILKMDDDGLQDALRSLAPTCPGPGLTDRLSSITRGSGNSCSTPTATPTTRFRPLTLTALSPTGTSAPTATTGSCAMTATESSKSAPTFWRRPAAATRRPIGPWQSCSPSWPPAPRFSSAIATSSMTSVRSSGSTPPQSRPFACRRWSPSPSTSWALSMN